MLRVVQVCHPAGTDFNCVKRKRATIRLRWIYTSVLPTNVVPLLNTKRTVTNRHRNAVTEVFNLSLIHLCVSCARNRLNDTSSPAVCLQCRTKRVRLVDGVAEADKHLLNPANTHTHQLLDSTCCCFKQ